MLDTYSFHDVNLLLFTRYLVWALALFKLMKSTWVRVVWNFFRVLFLYWMDFFISSFHQGTLGLMALLLNIPIVILAILVIMSVNFPTSAFTCSDEGVERLEVFFLLGRRRDSNWLSWLTSGMGTLNGCHQWRKLMNIFIGMWSLLLYV